MNKTLHDCGAADCPKNGKYTCCLCDDCGPPLECLVERGLDATCEECGVKARAETVEEAKKLLEHAEKILGHK